MEAPRTASTGTLPGLTSSYENVTLPPALTLPEPTDRAASCGGTGLGAGVGLAGVLMGGNVGGGGAVAVGAGGTVAGGGGAPAVACCRTSPLRLPTACAPATP